MNTSTTLLRTLRLLGAACLLMLALPACNTGTESGATNVERGSEKRPRNPGAQTANDGEDPQSQARDTATNPRQRQYENASEAKDRNNDGKAD